MPDDTTPSKRTHNTQLPDKHELGGILAAESQRDLPPGKEDAHYPDYSVAVEWSKRFEVPADVLTNDYPASEESAQQILEQGKSLTDQLVEKVLRTTPTDDDIELFGRVYDYLSEEDLPEKADLLFVFGSKTPVRIEKALELYRQGISDRIMISGGAPFYGSDHPLSEADRYKELAVESGVPPEHVIAEGKSLTIPDNVRTSLNMLDNLGINPQTILLVNAPYTQRRGWVHFKKYTPETVKLIRVNASTIEKYQRDQWFRNEDGVRTLANEFIKMKVAATLNTA